MKHPDESRDITRPLMLLALLVALVVPASSAEVTPRPALPMAAVVSDVSGEASSGSAWAAPGPSSSRGRDGIRGSTRAARSSSGNGAA